jgi:hypothetical protein
MKWWVTKPKPVEKVTLRDPAQGWIAGVHYLSDDGVTTKVGLLDERVRTAVSVWLVENCQGEWRMGALSFIWFQLYEDALLAELKFTKPGLR